MNNLFKKMTNRDWAIFISYITLLVIISIPVGSPNLVAIGSIIGGIVLRNYLINKK